MRRDSKHQPTDRDLGSRRVHTLFDQVMERRTKLRRHLETDASNARTFPLSCRSRFESSQILSRTGRSTVTRESPGHERAAMEHRVGDGVGCSCVARFWILAVGLGLSGMARAVRSLGVVMAMPVVLNVLLWPAIQILRDLVQRGESRRFAIGFLVSGTFALLVSTTLVAALHRDILPMLVRVLEPIIEPTPSSLPRDLRVICWCIGIASVLAIPPLVLAAVGGALNHRFGGFTIVTPRRLEQARQAEGGTAE